MKLIRGMRPGPLRTVLYGPEGIGKTTFAAEAPGVAVLGAEDGSRFHDVARIPWPGATPQNPLGRPSWESVAGIVQMVAAGTGDLAGVETLVIDTLDALEGLLCVHIAGSNGELEDYKGGYGKGKERVGELWRSFLADLDRLQARRPVNVILIAHAKRMTQKNPGGMEWQRWGLRLKETPADLTVGWADEVLFASFEIEKADARKKHAPGQATGRRIMRTVTGPGWVAKNRCGLADPVQFSFGAFWEKRSAALRGETDPALRAEAEAIEAALPEGKAVDAKGRRLLALALAEGPARVRRFVGWAKEQIEAHALATATPNDPDPTPETAPGTEDYPPDALETIDAAMRSLEADTIASAGAVQLDLGAKVAGAVEKFHGAGPTTPANSLSAVAETPSGMSGISRSTGETGIKRPARKATT